MPNKTGLEFTSLVRIIGIDYNTASGEYGAWSGRTGGGIKGIGQYDAIYTNVPIFMNDNTIIPAHKSEPIREIRNNVKISNDTTPRTIHIENNSSCSKTFTIPDGYGIDLRNPTWEYYDVDSKTKKKTFYCDKFGGDFYMNELFPSKKSLDDINNYTKKDWGYLSGYE